jgi:hypothetical protein
VDVGLARLCQLASQTRFFFFFFSFLVFVVTADAAG